MFKTWIELLRKLKKNPLYRCTGNEGRMADKMWEEGLLFNVGNGLYEISMAGHSALRKSS